LPDPELRVTNPGLSGLGGAGTISSTTNVSASSRVFQELRSRIISLKLMPGTILNRSELSEAFGVSQSPIREAILRLEAIDLVVSYRQSRTEVSRINSARLEQECFLRTGLECEVVDHLCRQGGAADLLKAKGYLKIQEALVDDLSQVELFRNWTKAFTGRSSSLPGRRRFMHTSPSNPARWPGFVRSICRETASCARSSMGTRS
jgi:DNA-binding GntR family transcriptional regulator